MSIEIAWIEQSVSYYALNLNNFVKYLLKDTRKRYNKNQEVKYGKKSVLN